MEYKISYRQKNKGWQYILAYKQERKWKQTCKQGFKTKSEAKIAADKRLEEMKELMKNNIINSDLTFEELLLLYIKNKKNYISESSIENMKYACKSFNQLYPLEVKEIKKSDIQEGVTKLIERGNKPITIKTRVNYLKALFNYAIEDYNIIYINPTKGVKIKEDKTEVTRRALTEKESEELLNALYGSRYYLVALIALKCGLRIGEILGLSVDDIDLDNNTMHITKQFKRFSNNMCGIGELKSKNSNRIIPIPNILHKELDEYIKANNLAPTDFIFNFGAKKSFETVMNKRLKVLGFNVCLHELRHTYATRLVASGLDLKTVAYLLGHDIKMTMAVYSHVNSDMLNKAASIIQNNF